MTNSPARPDRAQDLDASVQHDQAPTTPRWVKVSIVAVLILIVFFAIMHLTGNGFGHQMHMSIIQHLGWLA